MQLQQVLEGLVDSLVVVATDALIPLMGIGFLLGVILKLFIYFTVKRVLWFTKEFEKRVNDLTFRDEKVKNNSFFLITKFLIEKTYYEVFEIRRLISRRRPDFVMGITDRVFLIQQGCARLVLDLQSRIKHLHKDRDAHMMDVCKNVLGKNPCFNKLFAVIPYGPFNEILKILPGMLIVGGIFGTFLGIMKALPMLGSMDLNDIEGTKVIMDDFLLKISFSMATSVLGIFLSVCMTFLNSLLSPEKVYFISVNKMHDILALLWDYADNNLLAKDLPSEIINKDPLELLAEDVVIRESRIQKNLSHQYQRLTGNGEVAEKTLPSINDLTSTNMIANQDKNIENKAS